MYNLLVFITGICIGSFLNVCIYRLPLGKSIVMPGSQCPFCSKPIKWFDNIPLLSFLALGGKCRMCGHKIPLRYPFVELVAGLSALALFSKFGLGLEFVSFWIFSLLLVVAAFVDIDKGIIPDTVSVGGTILGIVLSLFMERSGSAVNLNFFLRAVIGAAIGFLCMFLLAAAGEFFFKKEALGGGDIKLMAMIGAFLGWEKVLLTFFVAPFFGAFIGLYLKMKYGRETVPYGPYLAVGAIISLFFGDNILGYLFNV